MPIGHRSHLGNYNPEMTRLVTFKTEAFAPVDIFVSYLLNDPLVGVKVEVQLGVVLLNDDPGGLLDCLGANTAHFRGIFGDEVEKLSRRIRRSAGKGRTSIIKAK